MGVDALTQHFLQHHPIDAARALEGLPEDEIAGFLARVPPAMGGRLLALMTPHVAAKSLTAVPAAPAAAILQEVPTELAAMLLRRMDRTVRSRCLSGLSPARSAALRLALRYPDAMVGSVLDPDVLAFPGDIRVSVVIAAVRAHGHEPPDQVFVIDKEARLVGAVCVKRLVVADANSSVGSLAETPEFVFSARASLESVQDHPAWRMPRPVPVVDRSGTLLGTVSYRAVAAYVPDAGGRGRAGASDLADLMYALAETVWDACAEIFVRDKETKQTRSER